LYSRLLFLQAKEKSLFGDGGNGVCGYIEMFQTPIRKWIYLNQLKSEEPQEEHAFLMPK